MRIRRRSSASAEDVLADPNKRFEETYGVGGILARLFRIILLDHNIDGSRWGRLVNKYVNDPANNVGQSKRAHSTARGNLSKELLSKPFMTFKRMYAGLHFLGFVRGRLILQLWDVRGKMSEHSVPFDIVASAANEAAAESANDDQFEAPEQE